MSEANGEYPPLSCSPCPFCGNVDLGIGRGTEDREGYPTYVYCATCGAQGPWIYTRDKGVWTCTALACEQTGWNKSANAPRQPEPVGDRLHDEMNRKTARYIAQNQALDKEAQEVLEESIFTALQIAEQRGAIVEKRHSSNASVRGGGTPYPGRGVGQEVEHAD